MISVCEENLGAGFFECTSQLRLHRGLRADRHEERRLHFVVQSAKGRGPCPRIARQRVEAKIQARRHDITAFTFFSTFSAPRRRGLTSFANVDYDFSLASVLRT